MSFFLLDHPNPNYKQYRETRRNGGKVTGTIDVHTAENSPDWTPPDTGGEAVAKFIASRSTPGSYHILVDSDSVIPMAPIDYEVWHDRLTNNWSIGLSFATTAARWPNTPQWWRDQALARMGAAAADIIRTLARRGITVPVRLLTRDEALARKPGFIGHGMVDTGRRSDPGAAFPWDDFFRQVNLALGATPAPPPEQPAPPPEQPAPPPSSLFPLLVDGVWGTVTTKGLQTRLGGLLVDGVFGAVTVRRLQTVLGGLLVDGVFGPVTRKALQRRLGVLQDGYVGPVTVRALQTRLNAGGL